MQRKKVKPAEVICKHLKKKHLLKEFFLHETGALRRTSNVETIYSFLY